MTILRGSSVAACGVAGAWLFAGTVVAAAQTPLPAPDAGLGKVTFQIDAQPIAEALRAFASQANLQLIYESTKVNSNIRSSNVEGAFTPEAALSRLLAHTNLDYKIVNSKTVSIRATDATPQ